jgi:hypothetical protein
MSEISVCPGCQASSSEDYDGEGRCWSCYRESVNGSQPERGIEASWSPIQMGPLVAGIQAGEIVGPVPQLMPRADGRYLHYPGEVHSWAGEPESGKGYIQLAEAARLINAGSSVLYLDFEDGPASIIGRLLALGASPEAIVDRFTYVRPCDPFTQAAFAPLLEGPAYAFAVIDGVSEAYALLGLDAYSNLDAAKFLSIIPRPLADRGAAVAQIDHVVKSKEARGRYALGAGHKLAGVAVAYSVEVITAPSRQTAGQIKIKVEKDRHGHVRGHAENGVIAIAHITPDANGERVSVTLEPPEHTQADTGAFRPTVLMERVSAFLEQEPGSSRSAVRRSVTGKASWVDIALDTLVTEGNVERRQDGQSHRHFSVRQYHETDDPVPPSQSRPDPVPDRGEPYRVPLSPPLLRDRDPGHGSSTASDSIFSFDASDAAVGDGRARDDTSSAEALG